MSTYINHTDKVVLGVVENVDCLGRTFNVPERLPNYLFDAEYSTQVRKEYMFLKERGIEPSFIKKSKEYNVKTYKYTKTRKLFEALVEYYNDQTEKE